LTYLRYERDVLKGCRIGGLTADPDVVADDALRKPLEDVFARLGQHIATLLQEAQADGSLRTGLDPATLATTVLAVRQGGYVMARAANSTEPYTRAVDGLIALIARDAAAASK
jgi:hypothetical protein